MTENQLPPKVELPYNVVNTARFILDDDMAKMPTKGEKVTTRTEFEQCMKRYWGDFDSSTYLNRRRFFPIDFAKLDRLFNESPVSKVVLHVTNIKDKKAVELTWKVYSNDIAFSGGEDEMYFILDKKFYSSDHIVSAGGKLIDGFRYSEDADLVCAMLGQEKDGDFCVAVNVGTVTLNGFKPYLKTPRPAKANAQGFVSRETGTGGGPGTLLP